MATAKPKVKRMMFGGAARSAAPMRTQSQMQTAKAPSRGALGGNRPPAGANLMQSYNAQKSPSSGQMPSQLASVARAYNAQKPAMKKGGAVKKKATKK